MAFKFKDLIVTLVPGFGADSGGSGGGTVGSCTAEGCPPHGGRPDGAGACGQSDEILNPLVGLIDPPFLIELRLLLRLAVAKSYAAKVAALEAQMHPRTLQEVDKLEKHLKGALSELEEARKRLPGNKQT